MVNNLVVYYDSQENHEHLNFLGYELFGLERERLKFFKQGMMPVFDLQKIQKETKS